MIAQALKRARELISDGWSEPFTLDSAGRCCSPRDEGVSTLTVQDALIIVDAFPEGWAALEAVVSPALATWSRCDAKELEQFIELGRAAAGSIDLQSWLENPGRKLTEVLKAFDVAILRAAREVH